MFPDSLAQPCMGLPRSTRATLHEGLDARRCVCQDGRGLHAVSHLLGARHLIGGDQLVPLHEHIREQLAAPLAPPSRSQDCRQHCRVIFMQSRTVVAVETPHALQPATSRSQLNNRERWPTTGRDQQVVESPAHLLLLFLDQVLVQLCLHVGNRVKVTLPTKQACVAFHLEHPCLEVVPLP